MWLKDFGRYPCHAKARKGVGKCPCTHLPESQRTGHGWGHKIWKRCCFAVQTTCPMMRMMRISVFLWLGGTNVGFMLMFRTARTTTSTKRTGPRPDRAIFATLDKCQESTLGDHLMVRMPRGSNNVQLWCQKNNLVEWNYVEFTDPSRRFVQCLVLWTIYIYIYPIIHTHTLYIYISA